ATSPAPSPPLCSTASTPSAGPADLKTPAPSPSPLRAKRRFSKPSRSRHNARRAPHEIGRLHNPPASLHSRLASWCFGCYSGAMKDGAISILLLALGVGLYGFAFGILAAQTGYPWWAVTVMSLSVYAGASQIVAVERFSVDGLVIGAALAGVALNLRYLGIIASVSGMFASMPRWVQLIAIHLSSDENWALSIAKN